MTRELYGMSGEWSGAIPVISEISDQEWDLVWNLTLDFLKSHAFTEISLIFIFGVMPRIQYSLCNLIVVNYFDNVTSFLQVHLSMNLPCLTISLVSWITIVCASLSSLPPSQWKAAAAQFYLASSPSPALASTSSLDMFCNYHFLKIFIYNHRNAFCPAALPFPSQIFKI